jgi:hypothetical protein
MADELLTNFVTKVFNLTDVELSELIEEEKEGKKALKEGAADILISEYQKRVIEKHKRELTDKATEFQSKALKDADKKVRDMLKEVGFESQNEKIFEARTELADYFKSKINVSLTEDQIKASPKYVELEQKYLKEVKDWEKRLSTEKENWTNELTKKETLSKVKEIAENQIIESKADLPKDATKRKNLLNTVLNANLSGLEYEIAGSEIYILEDGKRKEDSLGHAITFKTYVDDIIKNNFEILQQDEKGSGGSGGGQGNKTASYTFKTFEEYLKAYNSEPDMKKKMEIAQAWKAQSK